MLLVHEQSEIAPELRLGAHPMAEALSRLSLLLFAGFLIISTFEGAFRYYAAHAGVAWLVYLKDVLIIAGLFAGIGRALLTTLRNPPFLLVLGFVVLGTVIGILTLHDIRQPLFGAKTWLPLLCGTIMAPAIDARSIYFRATCGALWALAIAGVVLTTRWHAPWVGFDYEIGGMVIEGSREWSIGGVDRVAGFSRSSFDAALQCLFLGIVVASSLRFYLFSLGIWILTGAGIYLTTSRSALVALAVAMGLHFLVVIHPVTQRLAKLAVALLAVVVVALPFGAGYYYKNKAVSSQGAQSVVSASSFEERATKTWPDAFQLQQRGGNWLVGRGLGGAGVGQKVFETRLYNPGDNFFVYLWVVLGVTGMVLVAYIPLQALRTILPLDPVGQVAMIITGTFLCVGFTLNAIESAVPSLFLGLALGWLTQPSFGREEAEEYLARSAC